MLQLLGENSNIPLDIPQALDAYNGRTCQEIKRLHKDYGPIVAVGPRTVIFSDPAMIEKVYATRSPFPKVRNTDYVARYLANPFYSRVTTGGHYGLS